jgi:succinyl-CoA synthetase beta subunit
MRDQDIRVPIVVRLAGTNVEKGGPILEASGFPFIMANNLDDAATKVMETLEATA